MINHYIEYYISNYSLCKNAIHKNILLMELKTVLKLKIFYYDVRNIYHRYKKILETWNPGLNFQTSEELIFVKQEHISEHNVTFTKAHRSIAQHYLGNAETNREPQYVSNECKYFLYWLYYEVLEKKVDYHKVLKFYEDVIKGYMEESGNRHLDDYVSFRSDKTIEKFIKLTEMYDYFHKFKEEDKQHADRKCGYARECVLLYNKNIEICEEGNDYDFCYELDNLKKSYDEYMITNEDCSGLQKTLESYRLFNPTVVIITPFSILLVISLSLFFLYKVNFIPFQIYEYYTNIYSVYFKTKFLLN
ncbi:hypothetical protein PVMG_02549 [Plasmodium vivax Mauritania I]|uniref:Variable surface protein n=1 Tax=Plasmodium vivax Mauritania I TaxID=1035515 RepID=A0A0J9TGI4_PLAVI|nr:hypothetical protein PVMG_02549 [Plasmodium vivax Mauritania I]